MCGAAVRVFSSSPASFASGTAMKLWSIFAWAEKSLYPKTLPGVAAVWAGEVRIRSHRAQQNANAQHTERVRRSAKGVVSSVSGKKPQLTRCAGSNSLMRGARMGLFHPAEIVHSGNMGAK